MFVRCLRVIWKMEIMMTKLVACKRTRPGVGDLSDKILTITSHYECDDSNVESCIKTCKEMFDNPALNKNIEYIRVYTLEREVYVKKI